MREDLQLPNSEPTMGWKKEQIKNFLEEKGLDSSGTKQAMIERYRANKETPASEEPSAVIEDKEPENPAA